MTDKEKIVKHINELETYVKHLIELQATDVNTFLNDWRTYYLVDRIMHLSLEAFLSLGEMIISEFEFKSPDTYADIPRILCENSVIPDDLKDKLVDLAKFRNVLVHDYLYLDHEIVYQKMLTIPSILQEYIGKVKEYIKNSQ